MIKLLLFIIIMGALVSFIWHDEVKVWLGQWQNKAELNAPDLINKGIEKGSSWWEEEGEVLVDEFVAKLTTKGKEKIDEWLAGRDLNQYGDEKDTNYTGGTPLFDELTGESLDRYVYLLQKFPDLIKNLNLGKYLQ